MRLTRTIVAVDPYTDMAALIHLDVGKYVVEIDDNLLSEDIFNDFGQHRLVGKVGSRYCRVHLAVKPFFIQVLEFHTRYMDFIY